MPTVVRSLSVIFVYTFGCICQSVTLFAIILKTEEWSKKSGVMLICSFVCNDLLKCFLTVIGSLESLVAALAGVNDFPALALMNHIIGFLINASWVTLTTHLILMAANRFVALYLPFRFSLIFSPSNTKKMLVVCWLLGEFYCALHEFICCPLLWLVPDMGLGALPINDTYKFTITDNTIAFAGVIIPSILYVFVALKLMMLKKKAQNQERQVIADPKLCLQYALVLLVYGIMCVFFLFTLRSPVTRFASNIATALNYTATPVIYWLFNKKIREAIVQLLQPITKRCGQVFPRKDAANNEEPVQNHAPGDDKRIKAWSRKM